MAGPSLALPRGDVALPHALVGQVLARDIAAHADLDRTPLQLGDEFGPLLLAHGHDLAGPREFDTVVLLYEQVRLVERRRAGRREGVPRLDQPGELAVRCAQQRVRRLAA